MLLHDLVHQAEVAPGHPLELPLRPLRVDGLDPAGERLLTPELAFDLFLEGLLPELIVHGASPPASTDSRS